MAGTLVALGLGLLLQVAFSFLLVAQLSFGKSNPDYAGAAVTASWIIGVLGYLLVMAAGGCVSTVYARTWKCLNALVVGALAGSVSVWLLPEDGDLRLRTLMLLIAGAAAAVLGSRCWRRSDSHIAD